MVDEEEPATAPEDAIELPGGGERPTLVLTVQDDTSETERLVESVGHVLLGVVRQTRDHPDPRTFLGRGKLAEVRVRLGEAPPLVSGPRPLVVADAELRPPVLFAIEEQLGVEVWDRIRLILEIFRRHARIKEARLQVELARLRYELPYVHEALHRRLTGERPGFMGGGEVEIRTYETQLKRRTRSILRELGRIRQERGMRRAGRRKSGLRLVAIAGYTNSGKSSLLNELTASQVLSKDQLFSTLETTTRRLRANYASNQPTELVLTDTVGFIQNLPPWLIDAFSSTLEEISGSDAVILVVDANESHPILAKKVETALGILKRVHAPTRIVTVLHKADLVSPERRIRLLPYLHDKVLPPTTRSLFTSSKTKEGLDELIRLLREEVLDSRDATFVLDRRNETHLKFEYWLRGRTSVLEWKDDGILRRIHVRCGVDTWGLLVHHAKKVGLAPQDPGSTGN